MLRGVAAVVAGFVTMTLIVMAGSIGLMAAFVPGGLRAMRGMHGGQPAPTPTPTPQYYLLNLTMSLLAAMIGGWVTARVAGVPAGPYLAALAGIILVMGFVSASIEKASQQPTWYKVVIPLVGVAGVALSALVTMR